MDDDRRDGVVLLWQLGRSAKRISEDMGLSLADVCSVIAALSGRPAAESQMRQMDLFESQPQRDRVSDK